MEGKRYQLTPKSSCTARRQQSWLLLWTASLTPETAAYGCPGRWFGLSLRAGSQEELSRCSFLEILLLGLRKKVSWRVDFFPVVVYLRAASSWALTAVQAGWTHGSEPACKVLLRMSMTWKCTSKAFERGRWQPGTAGQMLVATRGLQAG